MPFGLTFNFSDVSPLQFWLTLGLGILVIVLLCFYLGIFVWYFGKPMRKYLTAKFNFGQGIIQEYTHENLNLKLAKVKDGEFTDLENKGYAETISTNKKSWQFWKRSFKTIYHAAKPIVAQSIISINGVATLMLWNINPPLPDRYLDALDKLTKTGYITPETIKQDLEDNLINPDDSIDGKDAMSYEEFLFLHEKVKSRNEIIVTPDDILGFSKKYMDEHAKKSVIEKEVTIQQKRATDKKYQTYAFMIILAMVIGGFIMIAYKIHTGNVK